MTLEKLLRQLKTVGIKRAIYPTLTSFFIIVLIALMILSARFLANNIDKAFRLDEKVLQAQLIRLNLDGFAKVAKKLGIQTLNP